MKTEVMREHTREEEKPVLLRDASRREVTYLRMSVTDRCNLRCFYCHPKDGINLKSHFSLLTFEELARVVRVAKGFGVKKFRITGGEPLLRNGIVELIRLIGEAKGSSVLGMTTNGILLSEMAPELKSSGLSCVNISLDTLDSKKFERITGHDALQSVLEGITESLQADLEVKINVVLLKGVNDGEILDFVSIADDLGIEVRFIELMPFGQNGGEENRVPVSVARMLIEKRYSLLPEEEGILSGPAKRFRLGSGKGRVGFIAPVTEGFCSDCNRLRLTCDGKLKPCLASAKYIDLRYALRDGSDDAEIERCFGLAASERPEGTFIEKANSLLGKEMREIGG